MERNKIGALKGIRGLFGFCFIVIGLTLIIAIGGCDNGTGTLSLGLIDAPTEDFQAVYVTIQEVRVHKGASESGGAEFGQGGEEGSDPSGDENDDDEMSSWQVVAEPNTTYNLLELVDGVIEQLGVGELEAGHYTQMRLLLGAEPDDGINILGEPHPFPNYVIDDSGAITELKVPSGYQSGIKLVHGFDIQADRTTELVLDFDASKSLVTAGKKKIKMMLKPTIKVVDAIVSPIITGQVLEGEEGLGGVYVSAQIYNPEAADPRDEVVVSAGTITSENGDFTLMLGPGNYNVVAYMDGYSPACSNMLAENNNEYTKDFNLEPASTEAVSYHVAGASEESTVNISVRKWSDCPDAGEDVKIEVTSVSISQNSNYEIMLPVLPAGETYFLVASTDSETQVCEWISGFSTPCEFDFSPGE